MLKSLHQADIDTIIAACGSDGPGPNGQPDTRQLAAGRERVRAIVEQLSREAQEELIALMWTGGPRNGTSFAENLELVRKTGDEDHAVHIAEQHARLPNYLRDGLKRLSAEQA